jgi:hypothetical protein
MGSSIIFSNPDELSFWGRECNCRRSGAINTETIVILVEASNPETESKGGGHEKERE